MINVEDREQIRRAHFIEKKSDRRIAKELGHSRKTVRKAIESAEPAQYTRQEPYEAPVLGPFKDRIRELLAQNDHLPRKQRYTGETIYGTIQKEAYRGAASTVRGYLAELRRDQRRPQLFLPLEFDPGSDGQVDWGEAIVFIAGERVVVQLFLMRLCYSRRLFVKAYPSQKQESFFDGHVSAFHHFQGIVHRLSYDNLKVAVLKILQGRNRQEQQTFIVFRSHYLFESHFCTPGQGHEKGRVESGVGFVQRRFLAPPPHFASFAELNAHLLSSCLADDQRCVEGQKVTVGEAWAREQPYLLPLPARDLACCLSRPVALTPYSQVTFETNHYSVPVDQAHANLMLQAYPFRVDVLYQDQIIASHPRCYGREQDILDPLHYLPLLEQRPGAFDHAQPMRRWRESWPPVYEQLLAQLRPPESNGQGVREFLRILKLHRDYPADAIEQAIRMALAYGCPHSDGVQLCLHQVLHPEPPIPPLDLSPYPQLAGVADQAPDLHCYDQLLEKV